MMWRAPRPAWGASVVARIALAGVVVAVVLGGSAGEAAADTYFPISGEGSSWSANAIDQWIGDVSQFGMKVSYDPDGSTTGREDWLKGLTDFAASDIPFQTNPQDGSAPEDPTPGTYAYMPITSGGTAFMYNLTIGGKRVTNLRLSGENLAKIFTGAITMWNDPALRADNPQLDLPARPIVPVVRSDGSGTSYTLSEWMISRYPSLWETLCTKSGRPADECGPTSFYPTVPGMVAQSGDYGVSSYVAASYADGAIGYVNTSYALEDGFPVVEMLNAAGYYTTPTPTNVAVSLEAAKVDTTDVNNPALYLTEQLGGVYTDPDPRAYPLSMYSYLILPTTTSGGFTTAKGKTLAAFAYYAMCQGQQEAMTPTLGYSPLPINLVEAAFNQIKKIPGAVVQNIDVAGCNNPTFTSSGANLLAEEAPMPPACAKEGPVQCSEGSGGDTTPTALVASSLSAAGSSSSRAGASTSGGSTLTESSLTSTGAASSDGGGLAASGLASANGGQCSTASNSCQSTAAATSGTSDSGDTSGGALLQAAPVSTIVPSGHGWTSTQTFVVLAALAFLLLILAPSTAARLLARRKP